MKWISSSVIRMIVPAVACLCLWLQQTGCANIQPPMGGAKDSLPPVLISATPDENSINFTGNTIRFQFDEYIQLENLNENLIINPPAENYPIIDAKLRNLTVKLKDTLLPNTTYTFNFGKAIKDVNEGNPFKDFSYSFSTGPYIDSLTLGGIVYDAETGLPDSTLILLLHSDLDDSAVAKLKPRFVTRPDGKGSFLFTHLPAGTFHVFALKDEGQKKYTSPETPFAFYDTTVQSGESASPVILRAFVAEQPEEEKRTNSGPSVRNKKKDAEQDKKLKYTHSAAGGQQDILGPFTLTFEHPVDTVIVEKIRLTDTLFNPIAGYRTETDSLLTTARLHYNWKPETDYRLILEKGFASDSLGASTNKNDTISFKSKPERDYGALKLTFNGVDAAKNPVLQWIQGNKVVLAEPLRGNLYQVKLFMPGEYTIRILYDANGNGIWDTGDYWKKIQPEIVVPVEQKFSIKPSWENEYDINLQ